MRPICTTGSGMRRPTGCTGAAIRKCCRRSPAAPRRRGANTPRWCTPTIASVTSPRDGGRWRAACPSTSSTASLRPTGTLFGSACGAQRLAACVRRADTLARHGGDEFVVVISEVNAEADCQIVADKILHALAAEFRVDGRTLALGASIGISLYPTDAGDGDALLRNADAAMYRAKQLGRNQYRFYGR